VYVGGRHPQPLANLRLRPAIDKIKNLLVPLRVVAERNGKIVYRALMRPTQL
jgi:hypothetical protein